MSLKSITRRLFGLTAIDSLEIKDWYIDGEKVTASATQLNSATPAVVNAAALGAGVAGNGLSGGNGAVMKTRVGVYRFNLMNGTAPGVNILVGAMSSADTIVGVLLIEFGTGVFDRTSEYTAGNSYMIKTAGSDDTGKKLYTYWIDIVA